MSFQFKLKGKMFLQKIFTKVFLYLKKNYIIKKHKVGIKNKNAHERTTINYQRLDKKK